MGTATVNVIGSLYVVWTNNGNSADTLASNPAVLALPQEVTNYAYACARAATWGNGPDHVGWTYNGEGVSFAISPGYTQTIVTIGIPETVPSPTRHVPNKHYGYGRPAGLGSALPASVVAVQQNMNQWAPLVAQLPWAYNALNAIVQNNDLEVAPNPGGSAFYVPFDILGAMQTLHAGLAAVGLPSLIAQFIAADNATAFQNAASLFEQLDQILSPLAATSLAIRANTNYNQANDAFVTLPLTGTTHLGPLDVVDTLSARVYQLFGGNVLQQNAAVMTAAAASAPPAVTPSPTPGPGTTPAPPTPPVYKQQPTPINIGMLTGQLTDGSTIQNTGPINVTPPTTTNPTTTTPNGSPVLFPDTDVPIYTSPLPIVAQPATQATVATSSAAGPAIAVGALSGLATLAVFAFRSL